MGKAPRAVQTVHEHPPQRLTFLLLQCDTGEAWCDPTTCQPRFSGPGSSCASLASPAYPASSNASSLPPTSTTTSPYISTVPNIDVCGHAVGGVSCPGAGVPPGPKVPGYYYRCCSSDGHCGPKNNIESQNLYCGADTCQVGFGDCATNRTAPPLPSGPPTTARMGQTCGPIVNAKCGVGLCCSGSNYCGRSTILSLRDRTRTRPDAHTSHEANYEFTRKAPRWISVARQTGVSRSGACAISAPHYTRRRSSRFLDVNRRPMIPSLVIHVARSLYITNPPPHQRPNSPTQNPNT